MARTNEGPRLARNERGVYEIRWSENRRTYRLSTRSTDIQAAQRFFAGWLVERQRDQEAGAVVTCRMVLDDYQKEHVEDGPVVDKVRQLLCISNLMTYFADIPCRDIDMDHAREYCEGRRDGTVGARKAASNETLRRELCTLKAAMRHAVKRKRMTLADVSHIEMPPRGEARDVWLDESERDQMLAFADQQNTRLKLFVYLALCTASRRHAIERLTWNVVDLQGRVIHFDKLPGPKTRKRRVPVPINDRLYAVLAEAKLASQAPFVLGHDGKINVTFTRMCRQLADKTGNRKFLQVSPHTLRHTWATLAARAGVNMYQIAGVLGDTVATVERTYLKHSPDHLRQAVNF